MMFDDTNHGDMINASAEDRFHGTLNLQIHQQALGQLGVGGVGGWGGLFKPQTCL